MPFPMRRFLRLPTGIPLRITTRQSGQKWLAALVIAAGATLLAVAWRNTAVLSKPLGRVDDFLYDQVYGLRTPEDRTNGNVVIVAIDDDSLKKMDEGLLDEKRIGWPWPRE